MLLCSRRQRFVTLDRSYVTVNIKEVGRQNFQPLTDSVKANAYRDSLESKKSGDTIEKFPVCGKYLIVLLKNVTYFSCIKTKSPFPRAIYKNCSSNNKQLNYFITQKLDDWK